MQVSIIIPIYNSEIFLHKCLDSLQTQTHVNWKAILVDDGSTDKSGEIAEAYAKMDSRFMVIHKSNEGQFLARLTGIEAADGDILMFLDSDDSLTRDSLAQVSGIFSTHANVDIVIFQAIALKENGEHKWILGTGFEEGILKKNELYEKLLISHDLNSLWLKAFRRNVVSLEELRQVNCSNIRIGEDKVMQLPLVTKAAAIYYLKKPLYLYTYNSMSASRNLSASKIPAMIGKEMFAELYRYMRIWDMDSGTIRRKIGAYYLKNLMACYFKMRKNCVQKEERKKFLEYPWKNDMGQGLGIYLIGKDLSLKEKIKLMIMMMSV